ncbi:nck-associated protein 1 homolog [Dysidea avara]|uniref:nck-associated protein 1 homolog n=1 Tax=Dysidea avara TaxID=196820 RepID=UPI00332556D6
MKSQFVFSITNNPNMILQPNTSRELPCELLSLERMKKWILFGFLLCPTQLNVAGASDLWKQALQDSFVIPLVRDEVFFIHSAFESVLNNSKDKNDRRRASEVQDMLDDVMQQARRYLRSALNELNQFLGDSPGLLGPQFALVLTTLGLACDEVSWLFRHAGVTPPKVKHKPSAEDFSDSFLPELLFQIVKLKSLVNRYKKIVQNYYRKYMGGYHATYLRDLMQRQAVCPEHKILLLSSIVDTCTRLSGKEAEGKYDYDFQGLRLDWMRLQAYCSVSRPAMSLREHRNLAYAMNTTSLHSQFVDDLDEVLRTYGDISFIGPITQEFTRCLSNHSQMQYASAFPMVAAEFMNACSVFAAEERTIVGERSVNMVNHFLELTAREIKTIVGSLCERRVTLQQQLVPYKATLAYMKAHLSKTGKSRSAKTPINPVIPGAESECRTRGDTQVEDSLLSSLIHLCWSINHLSSVTAWEHIFVPREYLVPHLEELFIRSIIEMLQYNHETSEIARPSEVLHSIRAFMSALRSIELHVTIDMTRVLTAVLLQETQPQDSHGEPTITNLYTNWYINVLLKRVAQGNTIIYSPSRKAFYSRKQGSQPAPFKAENYTDSTELSALADLMGPYGIRYLGEQLTELVSSQVKELKRIIINNKEPLLNLHMNRDKHEVFNDNLKRLKNNDDLIARTTIVGIVLAFRKLTLDALHNVLSYRIPFLLSSITDLMLFPPKDKPQIANEIASVAGIHCDMDPALSSAMSLHCDNSQEDFTIWSLFLVYLGVALPDLAYRDTNFLPSLEGHDNNAHCLAIAVNALAGAMFASYGAFNQKQRMKEFLVFTSSRIMKLAAEPEREKDAPKSREAVYLLLDLIVSESPYLTMDMLERCFPYALLRDAYSSVYRHSHIPKAKSKVAEDTTY